MAGGKKQSAVPAWLVMRRTRWVLVLVCLAINATAAPTMQSETAYYTVAGKTPQQIRRSIEIRGPKGDGGRAFHASTRWKVEWAYRWIESNRRCKLNQPQVSLKINMLLPKLATNVQLSAERQAEWDRYAQALLEHEQQHRDYAIAAARELQSALQTLNGWHPCGQLEDQVNDKADRVLDKYERLEREFDQRTDHGAKDGVVLPW